jgi:hypothetical protein
MVLVLLLVCLHIAEADTPQQSKTNASQLPSPQASTQPATGSVASGLQERQPTSTASSPEVRNPEPIEPRESFSQLTLFLFASGLALFVALLGWSDQIRGIDKDTRELEERFLKKTGINKGHFVEIVKSGEAEKQLVAMMQAVTEGKITNPVSVKVLESFDAYMRKLRPLEKLSDWKYKMTIALTIAFFGSGTASLFTNPTQNIHLFFSIRVEMIVLVVPMILIAALFTMIVYGSWKEKALRSLLNAMSDMV